MDLAFFADPLEKFKVAKDSTFAMMKAASRRGWRIYAFCLEDMALRGDAVSADARRIELTGTEDAGWFREMGTEERGLETFGAVIVRKDPPFDTEYLNATYLLELAERKGAKVFNKADALRSFNEKLSAALFPEFMPPALVASDPEKLRAFHEKYRDIILKPLNAMGGAGVFRIRGDGLNLGSAIEILTANGRRPVMAQQFIPAISAGDKRVLLVSGCVVPYALARIPREGEVRGNLAAGGTGVAQSLSARDREIAERLAPVLKEKGIFLAGLDIIGDFLTEVNVTSPTCFREIAQQTGFDTAELFISELEKVL